MRSAPAPGHGVPPSVLIPGSVAAAAAAVAVVAAVAAVVGAAAAAAVGVVEVGVVEVGVVGVGVVVVVDVVAVVPKEVAFPLRRSSPSVLRHCLQAGFSVPLVHSLAQSSCLSWYPSRSRSPS